MIRTTRSNLTKRQQQVLDFILSEINRKGYPPSIREIGKAIGLTSSSTVHSHLAALERKGYIRRDPTKPRALEVVDFRLNDRGINPEKVRNVPLVGRVAAGSPLLAQENIEDNFALPAELASEGTFMLRVEGSSMIEAGILDGDYLIVKQQPTADNGDIVVALLGDEATVKRFYKKGDRIVLKPENKSMEPIIAADAKIIGKAIGLIRKF
ncbi:MAG: transcriptional repressor LexA [Actinomycetota bacterium]|nr:transcriptional repressor LexA [Actinomycetota bacterium]